MAAGMQAAFWGWTGPSVALPTKKQPFMAQRKGGVGGRPGGHSAGGGDQGLRGQQAGAGRTCQGSLHGAMHSSAREGRGRLGQGEAPGTAPGLSPAEDRPGPSRAGLQGWRQRRGGSPEQRLSGSSCPNNTDSPTGRHSRCPQDGRLALPPTRSPAPPTWVDSIFGCSTRKGQRAGAAGRAGAWQELAVQPHAGSRPRGGVHGRLGVSLHHCVEGATAVAAAGGQWLRGRGAPAWAGVRWCEEGTAAVHRVVQVGQ